jgi:deoxyribodipyrimidine photo-lyase
MNKQEICIFWFRRDLRLDDNAGLYAALRSGYPVLPLFIFDRSILDHLEKDDRRIIFIHQVLQQLQEQLKTWGSTLKVMHGFVPDVFRQLQETYVLKAIFTNHDYEPYATKRDENILKILNEQGIAMHTYKDQVIFEKDEVLKPDGKPYTIFTPYSVIWKKKLNAYFLKSYPVNKYADAFLQSDQFSLPELKEIGFSDAQTHFPPAVLIPDLIRQYEAKRNFPAIEGTSRLSVHLRFGTISIRKLASEAKELSVTWLNELIWREFFMMILWHFPHSVDAAFKPAYDRIVWRNNEQEFKSWCEGRTGYPIVDAGMRELNQTGFMHNRVRMITASFLTKHLLIDWRWGERYFAEKLLDFELSANVGNWQWAAGSGCDAAPYFRIFNPTEQTKKFDPKLQYIRKWVPEIDSLDYPRPIVDHAFARARVLEAYKTALGN